MKNHTEKIRRLKPLDRLVYWIVQREAIRLKKEAGEPQPWTDDEILSTYRFCNVRRADDKVSQWLINQWYKPHFNHPHMLQAVALARFINKIETLSLITDLVFTSGKPKFESIKKTLRKHRDSGNVVFGAAYMIRGNEGGDKIECVTDFYVKPLKAVINPSSMEETWSQIIKCFGMGSFMSGQLTADLRHAIKGTWADKMTWAPVGPGSTIGLNLAVGRTPITKSWNQKEFIEKLISVKEAIEDQLPLALRKRIELMDWQNTMCEFRAYDKALFNYGTPKRLYR